ncbi:hypothetical protein PT974_08480 [Cladobotryum mycophilum]|uniref:LPXTG-motif cell wall anchor domain protein n=1 Tax=Cladobotryum mycophilum TaxID=491253 RepID=A0ABR0SE29_9HYPO
MTETETASFTHVQVAHVGQAPASSTTTASFQGKTQTPTSISSGPSLNLHSHRQNNNASKLPSFRLTDIKSTSTSTSSTSNQLQSPPAKPPIPHRRLSRPSSFSASSINPLFEESPLSGPDAAVRQEDHDSLPTKPTLTRTKTAPAPSTTPRRTKSKPSIDQLDSTPQRSLRTRASSYQTKIESPIAEQPQKVVRHAASVPESLVEEGAQSSSLSRTPSIKKNNRRPPASYSSNGVATSSGPPPSLSTQRRQAVESLFLGNKTATESKSSQERDQGQGEPTLPKTLSQTKPPDESRDQSANCPPVSYKPPVNNTTAAESGTSTRRVPPPTPKRSSRLVNHRKSIDMNFTSRTYDFGGGSTDANQIQTFRGFESSRQTSTIPPSTPISSPRQLALNNDDTGDVFLKIASEENTRRTVGDNNNHNSTLTTAQSRTRSTHRRPLSTTVTSYHITSPPRLNRRLSDQQERARSSGRYDEDVISEVARTSTYEVPRTSTYRQFIGKAASSHPAEDASTTRSPASGLRPSPIAPRPLNIPEHGPDNSSYGRRRPSITDSHSMAASRSSILKSPVLQGQPDILPTVEGTESTGSTTGPSTVWDELDDLKSRIHRLELTGKLPPTSGAAVIKASEDRPATATTTMTTMSLSPKKSATGLQAEVSSNASSHREPHPHHPNLHSALSKTKTFLTPEVFRALETAANDALALSSLMGAPGQPGPISSAASATGAGPMLTDRQLRRRADSVCRSLTELCIALNENSARTAIPQQVKAIVASQKEGPVTPSMVAKSYGGLASRRPSVVTEQIPEGALSPRAVSKFEERRNMILNGNAVTSPRHMTPATPIDAPARRSSLVVARTRRAGTEEPEDGRRSTMLLRNRRAGTEEPDEGRKTSFLVRGRRGTVGEDSEDVRFRAPSRATTEVNGTRGMAREYISDVQASRLDGSTQPPSALGRRRFVSSNLHSSRTVVPASSIGTPVRKYIERSIPLPEADSADEYGETRVTRHMSFNQSGFQTRINNATGRRMINRNSVIVTTPSTAGQDNYR